MVTLGAPFGSQVGVKIGPKIDQKSTCATRPPQDRPRAPQERPKSAPREPKRAQEAPKRRPRASRRLPKAPKRHPRAPKRHPRERIERRWLCRLCRLQLATASVLVSVWFALGCSGCFGCFGCLGLKIDRCSRPWVCFVELIRCCRPWVCFLELIRRFPFSAAQVSSPVPPLKITKIDQKSINKMINI